jgi:hypothetical protein
MRDVKVIERELARLKARGVVSMSAAITFTTNALQLRYRTAKLRRPIPSNNRKPRRKVAMNKQGYLIAAAFALASCASTGGSDSRFTISSPALENGGKLAQKYAGNNPQNKNCDGQNVSIPLAWQNAPANTKSFAIMMTDLVGRGGLGVSHWVAYDIPASKTSLKEGEASEPSKDIVGGKNITGSPLYFGPCPPMTDTPHPYTIVLIATDIAPGTLKPGLTATELGTALNGHALGATSFVANYRP